MRGKKKLLYPSRGSGRYIYLSPAAAGDIYFVRADRRGLIKRKKEAPRKEKSSILSLAVRPEIIKRKKERPNGQAISIHPTPARGWDS